MKKVASIGAIAAMFCCSMLLGGCATEQPRALTGTESPKHEPTLEEKRPYIDTRGHYHLEKALQDHPDWAVNWGPGL